LFCIPRLNAEEVVVPKDTVQLEAVSFDSTTYQELKAQKKFNYYSQQPDEPNALQRLRETIFRWLLRHNPKMTEVQFNKVLIVALIVILVLVIVFLYIYKPSLFYINRKQKLDYQLEEEDIGGLNFDRLIQEALRKEQYSEAIRWSYLSVLKRLNERELISFDPHKTVNEYVHELKRTDLKADFRNLSRQFIYYRYGNGEATRTIFNTFQELSSVIAGEAKRDPQ
jgi:cell division protein FtsL